MSLIDTAKRISSPSGPLGLYGFYALALLLFFVSGCTSIKVVRLPPPDTIMSDSVKEVEAVLTGEAVVKSSRIRTKRVLRLEARATRLEADVAVLEAKSFIILSEYNKEKKLKREADMKVKNLEVGEKGLKEGSIPEEPKKGITLKIVLKKLKKASKEAEAIGRKLKRMRPRYIKSSFKLKKMRVKAVKARLKAKEAQSAAELKVARRFASKLEEVKLETIVEESKGADVILLGEVHDSEKHHQFQLDVIKALVKSGRKIAIGMEMFMVDSQEKLDGWIDGEIDFEDFRVLYYTNWKTPWVTYAPIILYAKEKKLDIVALSLERSAIKEVFPRADSEPAPEPELKFDPEALDKAPEIKVTRPVETDAAAEVVSVEGIGPDGKITPEAQAEIDAEVEAEVAAALEVEEEEKEEPSLIMTRDELESITCNAEPEYKSMLRDAIAEHAGDINFDLDRFCRIQIAWDIAMAKSAKAYIEDNPETTLVVIAGGMHVWKRAIPKQLTRLGSESIAELAQARVEAKKARAAAKKAKAAVKEAEETVSNLDIIAARARRVAREAAKAAGKEAAGSFMGLSTGAEDGAYKSPTASEAADMEAASDAGASADVARHNAESAADRLKELEDVSKEAAKVAKAATKKLKHLKKSKSEFNSIVIIPEMPRYEYFRSGSASTDDGDYLLLY